MRTSKLAAVLGVIGSFVAAVVACGGCSSSTADGSGRSGAPISCTAVTTLSPSTGILTGLDDACLNGPTIRQILALVHPSYSSTLTLEAPASAAGTKKALTIGISYGGAPATCASQQLCPPGHGTCSPTGKAKVDVPVTMTFKTDDGAFDDAVPITLTFNCDGQDMPVTTVGLEGSLPVAMHKGTYVPRSGTTDVDFSGSLGATANGIVGDKSPQFSAGDGTWM